LRGTLRIAVWTPLPPSSSGIADYVREALPELQRHLDVVAVCEDPAGREAPGCPVTGPEQPPQVDLDVYHLGNSPPHAFVYRRALEVPGVVMLHEWNLHHLVLRETVERGDLGAYLRAMRRDHREAGSFVGRQVARALGGELLPALYALNQTLLERSLAVVGLTSFVADSAKLRLPGRPVLHLPHHFALPLDPVPSREQARRQLGLPGEARLVTAPGLATPTRRLDALLQVILELRRRRPELRLVVAGGSDPRAPVGEWARSAGDPEAVLVTGRLSLQDFARHLIAADVVAALRFPSYGEISGALIRALGAGRACLVTGATPAADEFPEGLVVPIDPGAAEGAEIRAFLEALLDDPDLAARIGRLAAARIRASHDLAGTAARLAGFLAEVAPRRRQLGEEAARGAAPEGSLLGLFGDELRWSSRELGLASLPAGVEPLLAELASGR
jgi:glycosyltransferase involved in cell wall biosynthesis